MFLGNDDPIDFWEKGPSQCSYSNLSPRVLTILLKEWTESLHRQRAYVLLEWPEAINSWSFQKQEEEIEAIRRALSEGSKGSERYF